MANVRLRLHVRASCLSRWLSASWPSGSFRDSYYPAALFQGIGHTPGWALTVARAVASSLGRVQGLGVLAGRFGRWRITLSVRRLEMADVALPRQAAVVPW